MEAEGELIADPADAGSSKFLALPGDRGVGEGPNSTVTSE